MRATRKRIGTALIPLHPAQLHADMQNGWDVEVLREIIDTCFSKKAKGSNG